MGVSTAVCVLLLNTVFISTLAEKHSLYYIYTALNKDLDLPGFYEFTALGLLDDREIDYYNSKEQKKIPKQSWMMEKMQEDYWEKGTQSRKSKEQWFKVNLDILMQRMNHNNQDLHVLQWRHGCEIDESNGEVKFLRGIDEYSYDGSDFLSFDDENMRWVAPVQAAEITKRKWDDVAILNQYTKGYLEKECVDWLTKFMEYGKESMRNYSAPDVYVFATKSVRDPKKLILTCLATGFYPKDVEMGLTWFPTSIPEHVLTSSGVRPNDDGTYQLRKSVEILEDDPADYDCYMTHSSLTEPVIIKWEKPKNGSGPGLIGGAVVIVILLILLAVLIFVLRCRRRKRRMDGGAGRGQVIYAGPQDLSAQGGAGCGQVIYAGPQDLSAQVLEIIPDAEQYDDEATSLSSDQSITCDDRQAETANGSTLQRTPSEQRENRKTKTDVGDLMASFLDMQKKQHDEFMQGEQVRRQQEKDMLDNWMKAQIEMEERRQYLQRKERQESNRMLHQMMTRLFEVMVPPFPHQPPSHPPHPSYQHYSYPTEETQPSHLDQPHTSTQGYHNL